MSFGVSQASCNTFRQTQACEHVGKVSLGQYPKSLASGQTLFAYFHNPPRFSTPVVFTAETVFSLRCSLSLSASKRTMLPPKINVLFNCFVLGPLPYQYDTIYLSLIPLRHEQSKGIHRWPDSNVVVSVSSKPLKQTFHDVNYEWLRYSDVLSTSAANPPFCPCEISWFPLTLLVYWCYYLPVSQ